MVNFLILPYLAYCNLIWSCASPSTINKIATLQKAIRIINKAGYRDHTTPLFKKLGLLKVEDIHRQQILIFMYKFSCKQLPDNFSSCFHETSTVQFHITRNSDGYFIPSANTNIQQKCIRHSGPQLWNQLPCDIKQAVSLPTFKSKLKKLLWNEYI